LRLEDIFNQRLCDAKRNNVTDHDVYCESDYSFLGVALALEGEKLVEKIAQYASENVVRGGRHPEPEMEHVQKQKRNSVTENGVCNSDEDKFPKSFVEKFGNKLFHFSSPLNFMSRV
jgi:hypothetical protein